MNKQKKWTFKEKVQIVKEFKKGATCSYLMKKYDISNSGTISRWNKEYDERRLDVDNRGKRKSQQIIDNAEILKKTYALLMEIRTQQHK